MHSAGRRRRPTGGKAGLCDPESLLLCAISAGNFSASCFLYGNFAICQGIVRTVTLSGVFIFRFVVLVFQF